MKEDSGWVEEEFAGIDFGDRRLDRRFVQTARKLAAKPLSSINQAMDIWADAKGAYRLFANEKIQAEEIIGTHALQTMRRVGEYSRVLVVQDTSYISYDTHRKTEGLGLVGSAGGHHSLGLIMHSSLALTEQGLPLGLVDQQIWARSQQPKKMARHEYRKVVLEDKESGKWLKALRQNVRRFQSKTQVITIADREADFYEMFQESEDLQAEFVIRACYDRNLADQSFSLWQSVEGQSVLGTFRLKIFDDEGKKPREAEMELRSAEVFLEPPEKKNRGARLRPVKIWIILVQEKGTELKWLLLSSLPARTLEEAQEKVQWYRLRWQIESFHKVLKSGCRVEACRLETASGLKRFLALSSVIAWRLHWLAYLHRHHPDTPANEVLGDPEWQSLYCRIHKTRKLPEKIPTAYQVTRWIAQLGGFLARKSDGEPGITTLWRGWQRLHDITEDYLLFADPERCG